MAKKIKLTRKDTFLVISGVLIAFLIQSIYDLFRLGMNIAKLSDAAQGIMIGIAGLIFCALALLMFRNVEEK